MTAYVDASVLVSLFLRDSNTTEADAILRESAPVLVVSDFAAAEFSSAVARRVRTGDITLGGAQTVFANFDGWTARAAQRAETVGADVVAATAFVRRLDLVLRAPDALNIAIAQRIGARLVTFDVGMERAARKLGVPVLEHKTKNRPR